MQPPFVKQDKTEYPVMTVELESAQSTRTSGWRPGVDLFLISLLILFLELACIRWFPAHVLYLTFFTNLVLLACFLGMSVGCLAAARSQRYLTWTPALLALAVVSAHAVDQLSLSLRPLLDVGGQSSPQLVYFGAEYEAPDLASFRIPIEVVGGFFFLVLALAFLGPGQELGRALDRLPNRVWAYTVNISGSIAGIVLFAGFSYLQLSPLWWFLPPALLLGYLLYPRGPAEGGKVAWGRRLVVLGVVLAAVGVRPSLLREGSGKQYWSPYYRIDFDPTSRIINVNLIGHQQMVPRAEPNPAYALPHLLNRDSGGPPFKNVLIIGAGSGNDVSRALQWGAEHIDAVEIDPVIHGLGVRYNPDQPYQDSRVTVHLDDGRNFLRSTDKQYDLIVYALVDSLVLHSSYSNIRLESYLFTRQAFEDVKKRLKPDGLFVMYNFFRQGWIVARLEESLTKEFGAKPLVLTMPCLAKIQPDEAFQGFTVFIAGGKDRLGRLTDAFRKQPEYWIPVSSGAPLTPDKTPNGFADITAEDQQQRLKTSAQDRASNHFGLATVVPPAEPLAVSGMLAMLGVAAAATVVPPAEPLAVATDDWPFLYLRSPMIPLQPTLSGMAVMAIVAVVLLYLFAPASKGAGPRLAFDARMFFLGAGFMLVETKAVVHMALLFGSTWMVNSVVFFAVLVMILLANLFVQIVKPRSLWPYYAGLMLALAANLLVPLDFFLGQGRAVQVIGSCLLVFTPILFAGVIFATSFARTKAAGPAFGANIAGAMLGGLAENSSMVLGFQYLLLLALLFYVLSMFGGTRPVAETR
jgi:SAM-dependent methyltransferase